MGKINERTSAVGGGWIWMMNKVQGGSSSVFYNLLGCGSHIWIAHDWFFDPFQVVIKGLEQVFY